MRHPSVNLVVLAAALVASGRLVLACSSDDAPAASATSDAGTDGTTTPPSSTTPPPGSDNDGGSDSGVLGPDEKVAEKAQAINAAAGGTIEVEGGAKIEIPAGALAADVEITVRRWKNPLPPPFVGASPRYEFLPDGTVFTKPVKVTIPIEATGTGKPHFYWSKAGGGWEDHNGTIAGSTITAETTHFSSGGASYSPICPTQGGNTVCGALGTTWLCCYGSTVLPDAESSFCFDRTTDLDHCGGCEPENKCALDQVCANIGGNNSVCETPTPQ